MEALAPIKSKVDRFNAVSAAMGEPDADFDALMEEIRSWSRHYTRAAFIDLELNDGGVYAERAEAKAAKEGWRFERMSGDTRLMRMLIHGEWPEEEFLVVPAGQAIAQSYKESIVKAVTPVAG